MVSPFARFCSLFLVLPTIRFGSSPLPVGSIHTNATVAPLFGYPFPAPFANPSLSYPLSTCENTPRDSPGVSGSYRVILSWVVGIFHTPLGLTLANKADDLSQPMAWHAAYPLSVP